jgi:nitroimidazol reductase NimA-like FMN-containing flavoprotein (pyridoxamine 5'-phosphate oxidase superfamily)
MALNLSSDAADYLVRHHVMPLATHGSEGPWAAVFYVRVGDDLIFLSSPSGRHCRNLALQPRCSATIRFRHSVKLPLTARLSG